MEHCPECPNLKKQLEVSEAIQSKQRCNIQKIKEKIIDTGKLIELYSFGQQGTEWK